jgi:hypothetical protein
MGRPITPESHPRLVRYMQYQGILSEGEAISALNDVRAKRGGGCEAVAHYGGPFALFVDTVRRRRTIRRMVQR